MDVDAPQLSRDEVYLLDWIAKEGPVPVGPCYRGPLDGLVAKRLVVVLDSDPLLVGITEEGWRIASGG